MTEYRIKPQYYELWGCEVDTGNDIVSEEEMIKLAKTWDVPIEELMEQVEEV